MKAAQFMQIKELEGLAPTMSVEEYVAEQVKAILTPQALDEVRAGFWSLVPATVVEDVTPSELRQIVCPTIVVREDTDMGLRQIFRVVFEDDVSECQPLVEAFHAVLDALSKDEKKKFLMFVTGIEVPPEPGTEQLTVQMPFSAFTKDEHVEMLGKLPQAHTCTNTLELPNYYESLQESGRYAAQEGKATRALMSELKSVMKDRLLTAIVETDSYELDATEAPRSANCPRSTGPHGPAAAPWAPEPPPSLDLSKGISRRTESESPSVATRLRAKDAFATASVNKNSTICFNKETVRHLSTTNGVLFHHSPNVSRFPLSSLEEETTSRHAPSPERPKTLQDVDSLLEDLDAALMT
ncbi:Probable E3 ubiquitin-protein ligase TOM1 (HECT-type E3 ubiquitin transferase TOM1) [Durusdinium trenchii]|uniref:HECT-type E3 ubiquitin transferase n=1 Tax=Durusdinium trenchii TaxID=1381693 RepID=A0ABP0IA76_9DINO